MYSVELIYGSVYYGVADMSCTVRGPAEESLQSRCIEIIVFLHRINSSPSWQHSAGPQLTLCPHTKSYGRRVERRRLQV